MADWQKIKTEYITGNASYRELAQKYGVNKDTIGRKAKDEGWVELRRQHTDKTQTKILEADTRQKVSRAERLLSVTDKLLMKVEAIVDAREPEEMDTQSLRHISATLKDIKDIQMIRSDADMREQEARIEKLRRDAQKDSADDKDRTVIVTIAGGEESWQS